ncbi:MAG: hypothetical protein OEW77_11185, partial [Gemmatimonadota bacterium]|nr:hypothetical protein [Gemmatimonadota bacterium]
GGFGGGMSGGMGGGMGGGQRPGGNGATGGGRPQQVPVRTSPGYVDLLPQAAQGGAQQGGRQQGGSFGGQLPEVTDAQCKAIDAARKAKPAAAKKVDELQTKMRDPSADRQALNAELRTAYTELGVEASVVRACRMKEMGGTQGGGAPAAAGAPGATQQPTAGNAAGNAGGARRQQGAATGGASTPPSRNATRNGLVFVQKADSTWEARVVRLGTADYDYTEVISGLQEGEQVALLSAAALQLQRQNQADRMKAMTGAGGPLGGASTGGGRGPGR